MKKIVALVVFIMVFFTNTAGAAEVAPCDLRNPWMAIRSVAVSEAEYSLIVPLEVEIFVGSGSSICMLNPGTGISLVLPKGFNPEKEHMGTPPEKMSWVKVNGSSFPIMSKYKLAVAPTQERLVFMPPQPQQLVLQQPSPLQESEEEVVKTGSFCGFWCKTAIGVVVVGLIASRNKGGGSTTTTSGGPVNPAP